MSAMGCSGGVLNPSRGEPANGATDANRAETDLLWVTCEHVIEATLHFEQRLQDFTMFVWKNAPGNRNCPMK